jgi:hypothetical protein
MRFIKTSFIALLSLILGYTSGILYFTVYMCYNTAYLSREMIPYFIFVAFYTFTVGALLFLPFHFFVHRRHYFWRLWICGTCGGLLGFCALALIYRTLFLGSLIGLQAAVIGAVTFISSALIRKRASS